jgi:hypothetical protein
MKSNSEWKPIHCAQIAIYQGFPANFIARRICAFCAHVNCNIHKIKTTSHIYCDDDDDTLSIGFIDSVAMILEDLTPHILSFLDVTTLVQKKTVC